MRNLTSSILLVITIFLINYSCRKDELVRGILVQTDSISNITTNSSVGHSTIIDLGEGVDAYGHCWDTVSNPNINNSHNNLGKTSTRARFETVIENLQPGTRYFVCAYASRDNEIVYGEEITFKTLDPGLAEVKTGDVRESDYNYVTISSNIVHLGYGVDTIVQYGHCWSAQRNPTIVDKHSEHGLATRAGMFLDTIPNLEPGIDYYIKAYVINNVGVSYGEQKSFNTTGNLPEITEFDISNITDSSVFYMAIAGKNDGLDIITRGICWNFEPNPDIEDNKIINGNDSGEYSGIIPGLDRATTYFFRAYATNFAGTMYSDEIEVRTLPTLPMINTAQVSIIDSNSAKSGGIIIDNGGEELLDRGIYWNNFPNPTASDNYVSVGSGFLDYNIIITNLLQETRYYVKAYATNRAGTQVGNEFSFITFSADSISPRDVEGNIYRYVRIGNQIWMAENLRTHYFPDGSPINSGIYEYKNENNLVANGYLYDWYTMTNNTRQEKVRGICPSGWHIPSMTEWEELVDYLGGSKLAGGKLKLEGDEYWIGQNPEADNSSGFSAYPSGIYNQSEEFISRGTNAVFWTSSTKQYTEGFSGYKVMLNNSNSTVYFYDYDDILEGLSVRCIKDE